MPIPFTCTDCGAKGIARYVGVKPKDIQCQSCHEKRLKALGEKQVGQFKADIKDVRNELKHEREQNILLQRRLGRAMESAKDWYELMKGYEGCPGKVIDEGWDELKKHIMEGE